MLPVIRWQLVADFLILAVAFYILLRWAKSARALRIALGVVGLHALALLARKLDLVLTSWVLDACAILAVLVLLLVFQPELRRAFMRVDSVLRRWPKPVALAPQSSAQIIEASFDLAAKRLGALIVITRRDSIAELIEGGVVIGGAVSAELIEAIFQKVSPLHDGAVIIEGDRLIRANTGLPLTQNREVPAFYGTRHRAAIGLAERSDALVTVVSEERGEVTLMDGRRIRPIKDSEQFNATLERLLSPPSQTFSSRLRKVVFAELGLKAAALGLAALMWGMSFSTSGTAIRTVTVPVEFGSVPRGLVVGQQSADTVEVQLRGSPWIMDSVNFRTLVGRFYLGDVHGGWQTLNFERGSLDLPPGITVDRVTPSTIRVQLIRPGEQRAAQK